MSCWPGAAPLAWAGPRRTSSGMAPLCFTASRASSGVRSTGRLSWSARPTRSCRRCPPGVRVVEDARRGPRAAPGPRRRPRGGRGRGRGRLRLVDRCAAAPPRLRPGGVRRQRRRDVALPVVHGFRHPLAAGYRTSLPAVEELIAADRMRPAFLFERSRVRELGEDDLLRDPELAGRSRAALGAEPERARRLRARARPSRAERHGEALRHARDQPRPRADRDPGGDAGGGRPPRAWRSTATWSLRSTATRSRATPSSRWRAATRVAFLAADAGG